MKIISRLFCTFFIVLFFIFFVFFGGGRVLISIGKKMEKWELTMKEHIGQFCQEGQEKIQEETKKLLRQEGKQNN